MWRRVSLVLVGLLTTACAAASSTTRPARSAGRDVITAAEIVSSKVTDVYQAVLQLRPEFLRKRTVSMAAMAPFQAPQVTVFLDDLEFGGQESMRHIPLQRVRLIRYVTPAESSLRWGGRYAAGVIHVSTLR